MAGVGARPLGHPAHGAFGAGPLGPGALPIGLSLSLVVLVPAASRLLLVLLSVALVVANVDSATHVRTVAVRTGSRLLPATELVGTLLVVATVTVPWLLGGFHPTREDLTWSILLAFATGLLSIYAVVLSAFDLRHQQ